MMGKGRWRLRIMLSWGGLGGVRVCEFADRGGRGVWRRRGGSGGSGGGGLDGWFWWIIRRRRELIAGLDLVISVDKSIGGRNVAGAMGMACWVLLALGGDWRGRLGRGDSPWYPGMRLFRQ